MDIALGFLTFGTLGFMAAFGYIGARATEMRRRSNAPKSLLSRDGKKEWLAAQRARG